MKTLQNILSQFPLPNRETQCVPISAGHINDSYWLFLDKSPAYVLQGINEQVFPDTKTLGVNLEKISACLQKWAEKHYPNDAEKRFVQLIKTKTGENFFQSKEGSWRLMVAIKDSVSYEVVENSDQAYEAGRLFGEFWVALSGLPPQQIKPTIHRFHDLNWRWEQLQRAYPKAVSERRIQAASWKKHIENILSHLKPTIDSIHDNALPQRIVHNDAKLSNALFDKKTQKGLCVIDLDTVMPGYLLYDFGDMVRSMCCPETEDSKQLAAVSCDIERFEALAKGYLKAAVDHITEPEIQSLAQSGTYMSLIMGIRFLTDFLQGSMYYKTTYPEHNLDRARNQITLALDLKRKEKQLHSILQSF